MSRLLALAIFIVATVFTTAVSADIATADAAFEQGDFAKAQQGYQQLIDAAEEPQADLLYNLGVTHHQLGDEGAAALAYYRAISLTGGHPEAEQNLQVITRKNGALSLSPSPWERLANALPLWIWLCLGTLFLWLALYVLLRPLLRKSKTSWWPTLLGALCLSLLGLALLHAYRTGLRSSVRQGVAVVTAGDISARTSPNPTGKPVLALPPGSLLRPLKQRGEWTYAQLPSDVRGWLPTASLQAIHP